MGIVVVGGGRPQYKTRIELSFQQEVGKCTHTTNAYYKCSDYANFNTAERQKVHQNHPKIPEYQCQPKKKQKSSNVSLVENIGAIKGVSAERLILHYITHQISTTERTLSDDDSLFDKSDEDKRINPTICRQKSQNKKSSGGKCKDEDNP